MNLIFKDILLAFICTISISCQSVHFNQNTDRLNSRSIAFEYANVDSYDDLRDFFSLQQTDETAVKLDYLYSDLVKDKDNLHTLVNYTWTGYQVINYALRSESVHKSPLSVMRVCTLDKIFAKYANKPINLVLFRGHNYLPTQDAKQRNYVYSDRAYLSTTISYKIAKKFAKLSDGNLIIDIIDLRKSNLSGLWVDRISFFGNDRNMKEREYEFILPRNLKFMVIKSQKHWGITYRHIIPIGYDSPSQSDQWDCNIDEL